MIWTILGILAGLTGLWLWVTTRYIVRATQGTPIPPRPGTALLLIETQDAFWTDRHHDTQTRMRLEAAISREVELARHRDQPVIALRQEWGGIAPRLIARVTRPGAPFRHGRDVALAPPFQGMADHVVVKRVEDGFETGELDTLLEVLQVGRLRIAGRDGTEAVARTAQAALNRGYEVELIRDAVATGDEQAFRAVQEALGSQGARII